MSDFIYDLTEFVDSKDKLLINGFIRESKELLKDNSLNIIPNIVYAHCLWYYFHLEEKHAVDTWTGIDCSEGYDKKRAESYHYMNINKKLLRGMFDFGLVIPSVFQQYAIPLIIDKQNIVAHSTHDILDNTAAFVIGILEQLDLNEPQCQALIISTSREAAGQQKEIVKAIGKNLNMSCYACIGGTAIRTDIKTLINGVQIICGTPGRICDMIQRDVLKLDNIRTIVLNEMNEILNRGLGEQIYDIFEYIPANVQIIVFAGKLSQEISQFEEIFMKKSVKISIMEHRLYLELVRQYYVAVEIEDYKLATLYDLFESLTISQCIIYCNTRRKAQWLKDKLMEYECSVCTLNEEMKEDERELIIKEFRRGSYRWLISNDLKKGLDPFVDLQVSLVINYDLPRYREQWIHRNGRSSCRFGRRGICICFVCDDEEQKLRDIENFYNTKIDELPMDVDQIMD